jgi:hypothetical protein
MKRKLILWGLVFLFLAGLVLAGCDVTSIPISQREAIQTCRDWRPGDLARIKETAPDPEMRGNVYKVVEAMVVQDTDNNKQQVWLCQIRLDGLPTDKNLFDSFWLLKSNM